jgi:hypothetical protein
VQNDHSAAGATLIDVLDLEELFEPCADDGGNDDDDDGDDGDDDDDEGDGNNNNDAPGDADEDAPQDAQMQQQVCVCLCLGVFATCFWLRCSASMTVFLNICSVFRSSAFAFDDGFFLSSS